MQHRSHNLQIKASIQDPYGELFLWAVLCKKPELLDFVHSRCARPLLMAEMAAIVYKRLQLWYTSIQEDAAPLKDLKDKFVESTNEVQ